MVNIGRKSDTLWKNGHAWNSAQPIKLFFFFSFCCSSFIILIYTLCLVHWCITWKLGQMRVFLGLILFYLLFLLSASGQRDWRCLNSDHQSRQSWTHQKEKAHDFPHHTPGYVRVHLGITVLKCITWHCMLDKDGMLVLTPNFEENFCLSCTQKPFIIINHTIFPHRSRGQTPYCGSGFSGLKHRSRWP